MAAPHRDRRAPMAVAMELASQITSVALVMALPAGVGYWIDSKFGSTPWVLAAGAIFGLVAGMVQLLRGIGRISKRDEDEHKLNGEDGWK